MFTKNYSKNLGNTHPNLKKEGGTSEIKRLKVVLVIEREIRSYCAMIIKSRVLVDG